MQTLLGKGLISKTVYDLPLRVTLYARVSASQDEQISNLNDFC